jgi:acyl-CoA synthetase (AMP-forming)/AMP-acid ligase II
MMHEETPEDCAYAPIPLYHGWANFVGFAPALYTGACFASRRRFSASEFLSDVRRHEVTIFLFVGELCRYLMRTPGIWREENPPRKPMLDLLPKIYM